MRRFIQSLALFVLPIFMLGILSEFLLRRIPNDYIFKKEFLDNHSDSIKVLFLGNSYAFYGINPAYFSKYSFNASHIAQSLDYDLEILKKYGTHLNKLECIAIPLSYFTLFSTLETGVGWWRVRNYTIYYGINHSRRIRDYSEVFGHSLILNAGRIGSYYIQGKSGISCSNLGWGVEYNSKNKCDLIVTGKNAAKRHTMNDDNYFKYNLTVLKSIIEFADDKRVKLFLYTPPAYYSYTENLDSCQLKRAIHTLTEMAGQYDQIKYFNFLRDSSFSELDFFDADHLNEIGAKKLTSKIDSLIHLN